MNCLFRKMIWLWIILGIFGIALITGICFLTWGFRISCVRSKKMGTSVLKKSVGESLDSFRAQIRESVDWVRNAPSVRVSIDSYDGLRLSARYFETKDSPLTMILFHGFRSAGEKDFGLSVKFYTEAGFSVLLVDERAHGQSEGKYITYGVRERFDCVSWVKYAADTLGAKKIILGGMSMGSTVVQMATGLDLPPEVIGVVADCGFTSPADIVSKVMCDMGVSPKLVLPILNLCFRIFAGFDVHACSTVEALSKNERIPVLFVHGRDDGFVPCEMSERGYAVCRAPKEIVIVDGADHGLSYLTDKERVTRELFKFIYNCLDASSKEEEDVRS